MPRVAVVWHDPRMSASLYESHVTVSCTGADEWVRLRAESTPSAPEVPAQLVGDDERYFEHHLKLLLDADTGARSAPYFRGDCRDRPGDPLR